MKQKVVQVGNAVGVAVEVEPDPNSHALIIKKTGEGKSFSSVMTEFIGILERVNKRYSSALRKLANE